MKYLVTGGLGFIGHNVVRLLEAQGHECIVVDTATTYGFIPTSELVYLNSLREKRITSEVYKVDIRDRTLINSLVLNNEIDVIVHLASFPRQKVVEQDPRLATDVMCNGLTNLLEIAREHCEKFVYVSSSMVYGDFGSDTSEYKNPSPVGQYGIMKLMGERLVEDYGRYLNYTIVRPSAVYGERDVEDRVVSKFLTAAMRGETLRVKGGGEVLDFTHVTDTAQGIVLATTLDAANGHTYNITRSADRIWTLKDAAELAVSVAGQGTIELLDRDLSFPKRGRLNIDRARNDLGYDPKIDFEQGLKQYYDWYNENPVLWRGSSIH